ncbi:MAG: rubrerythrin family protein [Clostridia bacterium]|nr:rubrerythrin family protein [Clostridia bacterium]
MVEFEKSQTKKILARLYLGECQDGARYQFLGQQAKTEKLAYMQDLMKALAKNEMSHAKLLYDYILKYGNLEKNIEITAGYPFISYQLDPGLKLAAEAEFAQFDSIYPTFARIAKDEGYDDVANTILMIADVENIHSQQLDELYQKLKSKKLYKMQQANKWKCSKCGHENAAKESWAICPLCHYDQGYTIIPLADN